MTTPIETLDITLSINDIIRYYPGSVRLLKERDLDTCCRGNLSLAEAAAEAGIDAGALAVEIVAGMHQGAPVASRCRCTCGGDR